MRKIFAGLPKFPREEISTFICYIFGVTHANFGKPFKCTNYRDAELASVAVIYMRPTLRRQKDKELVLQLTLIIAWILDIIIQHQTDSIEGCLQKLTCALEKKGSIFSLKSYIWIVYLLYTVNILGPKSTKLEFSKTCSLQYLTSPSRR